jgi:hypothetical protein
MVGIHLVNWTMRLNDRSSIGVGKLLRIQSPKGSKQNSCDYSRSNTTLQREQSRYSAKFWDSLGTVQIELPHIWEMEMTHVLMNGWEITRVMLKWEGRVVFKFEKHQEIELEQLTACDRTAFWVKGKRKVSVQERLFWESEKGRHKRFNTQRHPRSLWRLEAQTYRDPNDNALRIGDWAWASSRMPTDVFDVRRIGARAQ